MDQTLMRLVTLANGATQAWGPDAGMRRGTRTAGSRLLLADAETWTVDQLAWDYYSGARTHRGRLRVLKEAQDTLRRFSRADPSLINGTPAWRARIAQDGRSTRECALVYGVSKSTISNIKREAKDRAIGRAVSSGLR